VRALSVPARWACGVWQQEIEHAGGAVVYGWVDSGYVQVDAQAGQYGVFGEDALALLADEWGSSGGASTAGSIPSRNIAPTPTIRSRSRPTSRPILLFEPSSDTMRIQDMA
jgi:hypothetical protein